MLKEMLIEKFFPKPQHDNGSYDAKDEVGEIAPTQKLYVQQVADECSCIAAGDTDNKIHTTPFALPSHEAVGNITNDDTGEYQNHSMTVILISMSSTGLSARPVAALCIILTTSRPSSTSPNTVYWPSRWGVPPTVEYIFN